MPVRVCGFDSHLWHFAMSRDIVDTFSEPQTASVIPSAEATQTVTVLQITGR